MKIKPLHSILTLVLGMGVSSQAVTTGFVLNHTGNSGDWATYVNGQGGSISELNFDTHPAGPLQPAFYFPTHGVTLVPAGDVSTVLFGTGPNDGNTLSGPLSPGEGAHAASNYLFDGSSPSSLIINFPTHVLGAGLFIIDYFNPTGTNPLVIEAYSAMNGTGTLLGSFSSVAFNFQPNNLYFMGIASDSPDILSIKFIDVNGNTGDSTGIDNIRFATAAVSTPEFSSTLGLLALAFGAISRIKKRK